MSSHQTDREPSQVAAAQRPAIRTRRRGWQHSTLLVAGLAKSGVRPHVVAGCWCYSSPRLAGRYDLIGQHLQVQFRPSDRSAEATLLDGTPLGALACLDAPLGQRARFKRPAFKARPRITAPPIEVCALAHSVDRSQE